MKEKKSITYTTTNKEEINNERSLKIKGERKTTGLNRYLMKKNI